MSKPYLRVVNLSFLDEGPYTFSVNNGECVGLIGRSGIGKTQLFRAVTDLMENFVDHYRRLTKPVIVGAAMTSNNCSGLQPECFAWSTAG